jgi:hypothetical protein
VVLFASSHFSFCASKGNWTSTKALWKYVLITMCSYCKPEFRLCFHLPAKEKEFFKVLGYECLTKSIRRANY